MSIDYLGALKQREHEKEQDDAISTGGGGGTPIEVDQTYDSDSTNPQSGTAVAEAVAEAVAPALKNTATGTDSLEILGYASNYKESISIGPSSQSSEGATAVGKSANAGYYSANVGNRTSSGQISVSIGAYASTQNSIGAIAIGCANNNSNRTKALATRAIAIGSFGYGTQTVEATAQDAIQLGVGTNNTAKTLQVFEFQLLDGNTGKIPADRLGTGFDATKTQVLKNVNGTLTWVDE